MLISSQHLPGGTGNYFARRVVLGLSSRGQRCQGPHCLNGGLHLVLLALFNQSLSSSTRVDGCSTWSPGTRLR